MNKKIKIKLSNEEMRQLKINKKDKKFIFFLDELNRNLKKKIKREREIRK